jgi:hypothetical protein
MRLLPGLTFSLKRAIGLSAAQGRLSRRIGIPISQSGRERKLGRLVWQLFFPRRHR